MQIRRNGCLRLVPAVFIFIIIPLATAYSQIPGESAVRGAWQRFNEKQGGAWAVTWDSTSKTPKSLRGKSRRYPGTPEQVAFQFLSENLQLFQVQELDFSLKHQKTSPAGFHLSFQQTYQGLLVFNGNLEIHISPNNQVFLVHNTSMPEFVAKQVSLSPAISAAEIIRLAEADYIDYVLFDFTGKPLSLHPASAVTVPELGIYKTQTDYLLAYRLTVGLVRYTLDAHSGEILERSKLVQFLDGTGTVFDPNPISTLNDTTLRDNNDKNYPALNGAYVSVTLKDIQRTVTGKKARFSLVGPYVATTNISSLPVDGEPCFDPINGTIVDKSPPVRSDTNFSFTRDQSGFEHVMVYYHIDTNQRYIQSLGFIDINNRPILADAHAMSGRNAGYCPNPIGAGYIGFGDGQVDAAEDADVILHEFGHAIQDYQTKGKYNSDGQTGAMGEGFGDYWAFSNTRTTKFDPACFAEWFEGGAGLATCRRRLDSQKHYPEDFVGEVHQDGEIWSSSLRQIYLAIGKEATDKIVLQSHFFVPNDPNFSDGVEALLDADEQLFAGANKNQICQIMKDRGLADSVSRCSGPQEDQFFDPIDQGPTDSVVGAGVCDPAVLPFSRHGVWAQTFKPSFSGSLVAVEIKVYGNGTVPSDISLGVDILQGNSIIARGSFNSNDLPPLSGGDYVRIELNGGGVSVVAEQSYAIVARRPSGSCYFWLLDQSGGYARGDADFINDLGPVSIEGDLGFKTFMSR